MAKRGAPGIDLRKKVLGPEYVEKATARTDAFNAPIQQWLNDQIWSGVWAREGLPLKYRSLVVIAFLIAMGRRRELELHLRGAIRNGCSLEEIREVILQAAAYCGAPAAVDATKAANEVLADEIHASGKASSA